MAEQEYVGKPTPEPVNVMALDVAGIDKKDVERLAAVQKEMLAVLEQVTRDWWSRLNEAATLTSDFTKKVSAARSAPDVATAWQELMSSEIELLSRQGHNVLDNTKNLVSTCSRLIGNGGRG
jgi:hypothetical protein